MKNLLKIILTVICVSSFLFVSPVQASLKKDTAKIVAIVTYNAIRKEKNIETFLVPNEKNNSQIIYTNFKDNHGKLKNRSTSVSYNLQSPQKNTFILSVITKNYDRTNWKGTGKENYTINNKYSRINESSTLLIFHDKNTTIKSIQQQGCFAKQKFWSAYKTSVKTKGLVKLEQHNEAKAILETGENIINGIAENIPFFTKQYNKFINASKKKAKEDIEKIKDKFGKNLTVTIVPTGVPDKLTGQTMTRIDYKIKINPSKDSNIFFYHITNLGNPSDVENTSGQMPEGFAQTRCVLEEKVIGKTKTSVINVASLQHGGKATAKDYGSYMGNSLVPRNINDGRLDTDWAGRRMPSWCVIRFNKEYTISRVRCVANYHTQKYQIQLSRDGKVWNTVATHNTPNRKRSGTSEGQDDYSVNISKQKARFICVIVKKTDAPRSHIFQSIISELQAFGY